MSKIDTKEYVYVMISTLNQMVNYIPLKHFEFADIVNITIQESDYVDNNRWDEHLEKVLEKEEILFNCKDDKHIRIKQNEIDDIEKILDLLEANFSDKKVFWNITGGQRPIILAIEQFVQENNRAEDYICYLEGNKSKMVIFQNNEKISSDSYNLDDLKISAALELMGFKINKENEKKNYSDDEAIKKFYKEFLTQYLANRELREKLITLNKKETNKNTVTKEIKNILTNLDKTLLDEVFKYSDKDEKKQKKIFGYILESIAGYKILEIADNKIADINFSEKINHLRKNERTSEKEIDEFDIALLTKNGKFMIFECKSGGMEGDVAKSTKYSTYAVSGVYGLPILITPLLKKEIEAIRKKSHLEDSEFMYLKNDLYKTIRQAINSAIRANLEVWGLDEIEDRLKKYIDL